MIRRDSIALLSLLLLLGSCVDEVDLQPPQDAGPDAALGTDAVPLPDAPPLPADAGP